MIDPIEQFFDKAKTLSLTKDEKSVIRAGLISKIQISRTQINTNNFFVWQSFIYKHSVSFAFVGIIFFTGAMTAFAEKSFPGGTLYPVKTNINEKVLGLFARSQESRAEFQIKLAERRLSEVEYLDTAVSSPEIREIARERLEEQTRHVEDDIDDLDSDTSNSGSLSSNDLQTNEISTMRTESSIQASQASVINKEVSKRASISNKAEAEERVKNARNRLSNLRKTIYEKKDLSVSSKLKLKREIFLTEKAIFEVKKKLNSDDDVFSEVEVHDVEEHVLKIENHSGEDNLDDSKNINTNNILDQEKIENSVVPIKNEIKPDDSTISDTEDDNNEGRGKGSHDSLPEDN